MSGAKVTLNVSENVTSAPFNLSRFRPAGKVTELNYEVTEFRLKVTDKSCLVTGFHYEVPGLNLKVTG